MFHLAGNLFRRWDHAECITQERQCVIILQEQVEEDGGSVIRQCPAWTTQKFESCEIISRHGAPERRREAVTLSTLMSTDA